MVVQGSSNAESGLPRREDAANGGRELQEDGTPALETDGSHLGAYRFDGLPTTPFRPTEKEQYVICPAAYERGQRDEEADFESWWKLRGTIFHEAIQYPDNFGEVYRGVLANAHPDIRKHGFPCNDAFLATEKAKLMRWVDAYGDYIRRHNITILDREVELDYTVAGLPHQCHVDALAIHPDTPEGFVEIHDYKTGNKWSKDALNRKVQFGDYWYAAHQNGVPVNRVWWGHVQDLTRAKGHFLYPLLITKADIPYIQDYTVRVVTAIRSGAFPYNNYGVNSPCTACEFKESCPAFEYGYEQPVDID